MQSSVGQLTRIPVPLRSPKHGAFWDDNWTLFSVYSLTTVHCAVIIVGVSDHYYNFNNGSICCYVSYNGQITEVALLGPAVSVAQSNGKILWEACRQLGAIPALPYSLLFFFFLRYFAIHGWSWRMRIDGYEACKLQLCIWSWWFVSVVIFEPTNSWREKCNTVSNPAQPDWVQRKKEENSRRQIIIFSNFLSTHFHWDPSGFYCDPASSMSALALPYQLAVVHLPCKGKSCQWGKSSGFYRIMGDFVWLDQGKIHSWVQIQVKTCHWSNLACLLSNSGDLSTNKSEFKSWDTSQPYRRRGVSCKQFILSFFPLFYMFPRVKLKKVSVTRKLSSCFSGHNSCSK